jgi:hypothetical protein
MPGVVSNVTYRFHRHWHEGTPITFCRGDWAFASDVVEDVYGIRPTDRRASPNRHDQFPIGRKKITQCGYFPLSSELMMVLCARLHPYGDEW